MSVPTIKWGPNFIASENYVQNILDQMPADGEMPAGTFAIVRRYGQDYYFSPNDVSAYVMIVGDPSNNPKIIAWSPGKDGPTYDTYDIDYSALGENAIDFMAARWYPYPEVGVLGHGSVAFGSDHLVEGHESAAIGQGCRAGGNNAFVGGIRSQAMGYISRAYGYQAVANGSHSTATGAQTTADGHFSRADGRDSHAYLNYSQAYSTIPGTGIRRQSFRVGATRITTNATPTELTINGANPNVNNRLILPENSYWYVIARISGIKQEGDKSFNAVRQCVLKNLGGTTTLVGSVQTIGTDIDEGASGYALTLQASDANNSLQIMVTGESSETVRWWANLEINDVEIVAP